MPPRRDELDAARAEAGSPARGSSASGSVGAASTITTRRRFLERLARGTAYAVPVILSLPAPARAGGPPPPSQKMGGMKMGKGKGKGGSMQNKSVLPSAPWFRPPP